MTSEITAANPPLVLLVEDDADTREMYAIWLSQKGLRVAQATTVREAFAQAHALRPDIIVTDLGLGRGYGGCELADALRGDAPTRAIPVVALTGWVGDDMKSRAMAAGCAAVLYKPCDPHEILTMIRAVLDSPRDPNSGERADT